MLGVSPVKRSMLNEGSAYGDFYNAIDNFFNDDFFGRPSLLARGFRMDVKETGDSYIVEAELPGVKRDEIEIGYRKDTLYIATHSKEEKNMKSPNATVDQAESNSNEKATMSSGGENTSATCSSENHTNDTTEVNVKCNAQNNEVASTNNQEVSNTNQKVRYIHQERRRMSMQRGIYLPEVKKEAIEAKLDSGILTIVVPKLKPAESDFKIQIQ